MIATKYVINRELIHCKYSCIPAPFAFAIKKEKSHKKNARVAVTGSTSISKTARPRSSEILIQIIATIIPNQLLQNTVDCVRCGQISKIDLHSQS